MALSNEVPRSFHLYVTHVDGDGHFLKICGQPDPQSSMMVESLFKTASENLEKGIGAVPPAAIHEGIICAAKYKDGKYYRAKIMNTTNLATGLVGVQFIDYGNKDIISLSTIRFLDSYDPMFLQLRGQAADYYLSRIIHPSGRWEESHILKLQSLLCYAEYPATIEAHTHTFPIISIQFKGNDLSSHLVTNRFGIAVPTTRQEVLLLQVSENQQGPSWSQSFLTEAPTFTEHVPFLINQNFPNPASAMRLNQNVALPYNGSMTVPSSVSQRLLVNNNNNNKTSRNTVNLRAPVRQPQQHVANAMGASLSPPSTPANKPQSPKKSITYKSRLLEVNSVHKVFISYAEEGPELFAVQLVTDANKFQVMMDEINRRPHSSLTEPPMIGTVCLGRMSGDRIICRAIVMNLSGSQCKLFFVDFGDTEMVSYYDIFDIPEEFVKPNVYAMRFCLSGVKNLQKGPYLNEAFKQLVANKVLTLRVVAPEGPPLIQYGELLMDNKNVLDLLIANMKDKLQFKGIEMLPPGSRRSVLVSYVDSCLKFYVQLSDKIDDLNAVMKAVKTHCESSSCPGVLPVGSVCCARFSDDGKWYRARVKQVNGKKIVVTYVDYGNEQEVDESDLRTITPDLIKLPAQAMKCALKGFENRPVETKTSNQLEMIALEKTLMAHVVDILTNDTMLVSLVDDTVSPPLDVARRMNQLSQPRSNVENKVTTPVRKDPPEIISSPEGSVDDGKRKNFRREKSFKDDRKSPRDANEDFGQRGSSFRGRENFDRSGPGRHSEKFGGKPDRGDRRGGKPWENQNHAPAPAAAPISAADDEWEESPAPPPARPPRDNRDGRDRDAHRRKPRSEQAEKNPQQRAAWKKETCGVGKRIKQAAEAASIDAQNHKGSIQDRLKRENKFKQDNWEETHTEERGNRNFRDNRPERRDNRGDRRDNWGDKKENWGERKENWGEKKEGWNQKREFKDNRAERGHNSNFTPRERAERSFGSDAKSDKSYRSQDNGRERTGRAPPYKTRSKFTAVQYKELPNPVALETPFAEPTVETGAQHEVSVTWIISPNSFYTQILSLQPKFLEMMHSIPELYKGVKSYTGAVSVGASVLARYPADGVLYRATIVAVQPFNKFIVRYVDFGNKQLVDAKDIWQLDSQLMELPKMAVHCSLVGVSPKDGEWKANPEIDLCFNAPRYQCVFQDCVEETFKVSLWNNGASVADMLVEKELAVLTEHQSSVTLKDEAIDLTIIVGQQILCRVTHVVSFEKFYIQLDLDKANLVESAIAGIDTALLSPLTAESLADGIHCTVKHEDKIYRAILNDVSDPANIQAVLPDYGITITTTLDKLMILPTELSVYYYQALECCLNNYTAESKTLMTLEEMKEKLTGKKIIVYINEVEEIKLVSTLYDSVTGQKIAIFEPDEGAYDEVNPLCTRAVFNYNFGLAFITHIENLNEFYLQKSTDGNKIAQMLDDLYKFYEEGTPEDFTNFEVDALCAARSADGNWYRATIISVEGSEVKVQFPDYGNSETLPKESLKKLDPKFHEPCALALVASLGLVALQEDTITKLNEWVNEKDVQVTLAFGTDGWLASLHLDGVDLSMKLVNEKLATPKITSTEEVAEQKEEEVAVEPVSLPEGCTQVYISHIDTPGHFWLQMLDKVEKIEEIQAELQANADSYADIESREMGTLCIAKYLADDQWYRAEILDSDSDITTVRFIDYGNTDVLDNQPGLIKVIPDNLKEIERFAIKSSVNAVPTGTGEWSEPASECFTQLVGDISNPVDALIVLKDVTTYVDIFVNGQNLTDKLVSEGHAARSEDNDCGDLPSCFASHVNSPSEFWIQLETAAPELQAMESAMVDAENFPPLETKEEGVICAAKYPEDGAWYRAQVIVDGSEGTEVLFMDYGNASIANELRSLPDELKMKPALSRKCALQKPRDIKSWSRKSEIKFNELAAEGATIFNVQFIASGDISIVELYLEGKSVTEELVGLCEEQPVAERPTPVGQDLFSNGKICYVNTLEEFYVQLVDKIPDIDKITDSLSNAEEFEPTTELKVGSVCAAFWSEDEQWYRARILEFCDVGYHVQFIDYGNKAKCEDFRQLPENLLLLESMAKCCQLSSFTEDAALLEIAKSKLNDMAAEDVTFQVEFLDSLKEPNLVKLFLNNEDFIAIVKTESVTDSNKPDNNATEPTLQDTNTTEPTVKENVENQGNATEPTLQDTNTTESTVKENVQNQGNATEPTLQDTNTTEPTVKENVENQVVDEVLKESSSEITIESSNTDKNVSNEIETPKEKIDEDKTETCSENKITDNVEEIKDVGTNELDSPPQDLDESIDSGQTVIENRSFEEKFEDANESITEEKTMENNTSTPEKDTSSETLENSNDTLKTPEREESKDSINTDTGYTSDGEHDKIVNKSESPVKKNETKVDEVKLAAETDLDKKECESNTTTVSEPSK